MWAFCMGHEKGLGRWTGMDMYRREAQGLKWAQTLQHGFHLLTEYRWPKTQGPPLLKRPWWSHSLDSKMPTISCKAAVDYSPIILIGCRAFILLLKKTSAILTNGMYLTSFMLCHNSDISSSHSEFRHLSISSHSEFRHQHFILLFSGRGTHMKGSSTGSSYRGNAQKLCGWAAKQCL